MDNILKQTLRKSHFIISTYRFLKTAAVYPLRFTYLGKLQLSNFPLKDVFNPQKTKLLSVVAPYTLAGYPRMTNIYDAALDIERRGIEGAFVECGTWKGGCAAIMGAIAQRYGNTRKTWYFDSFEGMPDPTPEDGDTTEEITGDALKASEETVKELIFGKLHLSQDHNIIVKGWFENTFPVTKHEVGKIAILRIDADFYKPILYVLEELYDQVVPGGYIIFDDYSRWPGCRQAVDEFVAARNISPTPFYIGTYGARVMYWKKGQ